MQVKPYNVDENRRERFFIISGPKGSIEISFTYANKSNGKRDYHVGKINTGQGWTRDCPDMPNILLKHIGETYKGITRVKWIEQIYNSASTKLSEVNNGATNAAKGVITGIHAAASAVPQNAPPLEKYEGHPSVTEGTFVLDISGPTDKITVTKQRAEQFMLRANLMQDRKSMACAVCGQEFLIEHLVTAHIKKRSHANEKERLDTSIVVPMCMAGCDVLFEQGWIGVQRGNVVRIRKSPAFQTMDTLIQGLLGKQVAYWSPLTEIYFNWHQDFHHKKLLGVK